ncbi:unnamed protein product [Cuscuta europaea]|uniref:Uncharacterized protein n=1 Tax=Cuscuta europaea TaxID=41803 RepID=A0A9P1EIP0_CUSEU|nr:unnamed protein product [Cuscuta europaea]
MFRFYCNPSPGYHYSCIRLFDPQEQQSLYQFYDDRFRPISRRGGGCPHRSQNDPGELRRPRREDSWFILFGNVYNSFTGSSHALVKHSDDARLQILSLPREGAEPGLRRIPFPFILFQASRSG